MIDHAVDLLAIDEYNKGYEAAITDLEELSNRYWNEDKKIISQMVDEIIKKLKGTSND
jgi:hypothetical protein